MVLIRNADVSRDYDAVWNIFSRVIQTGDTYIFHPDTPKEALQKYWFADNMHTFVAVDEQGNVLGTYFLKPNQIDLGNHVANCGYMVSPDFQGKGTGKLMCEHSLRFARENGYVSMQFNFVVSTNTNAVNLWKKMGFEIKGVNPKAFRHQHMGLVDTYVMYRDL